MTNNTGNHVVRGIFLMCTYAMLGPVIDTFAKLSGDAIPSTQVTAARFIVQSCCLIIPILILRHSLRVESSEIWKHVVRGILISGATICIFTALQHMPIADAISIFFVEPLILTLLGGLILGERVGWRRYVACAVGFFGAIIVIRPSFETLGWPAMLPLGSAIMFALYLILTRSVVQKTKPLVTQFYAGLSGALFTSAILYFFDGTGSVVFDPVMPEGNYWLLLLGVGISATIAHLFLVFAFSYASASVLAPFQYLEIIGATILGYWIFDDFPDAIKWLGISIIVLSGLFVFWRERIVSKQQ